MNPDCLIVSPATWPLLHYRHIKYSSSLEPLSILVQFMTSSFTEYTLLGMETISYPLLLPHQIKPSSPTLYSLSTLTLPTSSWGQPGWVAGRGPGWRPRWVSPPWSGGWPPSVPWRSDPDCPHRARAGRAPDCCPHLPRPCHWRGGQDSYKSLSSQQEFQTIAVWRKLWPALRWLLEIFTYSRCNGPPKKSVGTILKLKYKGV